MLNLKFDTLRAIAYKANLPESKYYERYNLVFGRRTKEGIYESESWLAELPKGTILKNGTRIEIKVKDLLVSNGYSVAKKIQYAPTLRVFDFEVVKEPKAEKEESKDEFV